MKALRSSMLAKFTILFTILFACTIVFSLYVVSIFFKAELRSTSIDFQNAYNQTKEFVDQVSYDEETYHYYFSQIGSLEEVSLFDDRKLIYRFPPREDDTPIPTPSNFKPGKKELYLPAEKVTVFDPFIGILYSFSDDGFGLLQPKRTDVFNDYNKLYIQKVTFSFEKFEHEMVLLLQQTFYMLLFVLVSFTSAFGILFFQVIIPLRNIKSGALRIAQGNLRTKIRVTGIDELGVIGTFFNQVADNLKSIIGQLVEKDKLKDELDIAARIQNNLLVEKAPDIPGLDIKMANKAASAVGGDAYSFIPVDDDNILMYVGDVTGHGVPAALVMTMVDILINGFSDVYKDLTDLLSNVNRHLMPKIDPAMFVTVLMLNWNHSTQTMSYAGAGHESIIHYKAATKEIDNIVPGGLALGMIADNRKHLKLGTIVPEVGDALILYTDGIPEAWGGKDGKELYGMPRLIESVRKYAPSTSADVIFEGITAELSEHMKNHEQKDDITLMVIKYTGVGKESKQVKLDLEAMKANKSQWSWRK